MDELKFDQLLQEIRSSVVADKEYQKDDWDEASILVSLGEGHHRDTGYVYRDDYWEARTPDGWEFGEKCKELWEFMRACDGISWHQALIHITKPGPEINIEFEYDDPKRWSLKKVSLDMQSYADSLRPTKD